MERDYYYRPPATYKGGESLEARLRRKRGEPPPSEPFRIGPPPWLVALVMGGTFLALGLALASVIILRG
jgi:hypothetical protein